MCVFSRIRAKLGLKPLDVGDAKVKCWFAVLATIILNFYIFQRGQFINYVCYLCVCISAEDDESEKKKKEDVHVPAVSMTQLKKTEKLKEKLALNKERRAIESKLR